MLIISSQRKWLSSYLNSHIPWSNITYNSLILGESTHSFLVAKFKRIFAYHHALDTIALRKYGKEVPVVLDEDLLLLQKEK